MKSYEVNLKKILEVLLSNPRYLTLDVIARSIGLSKRSVQNYLVDIDTWLVQNGLLHTHINRKQGQGVIIEADVMDRINIKKLLHGKSLSIYSDDNKRRLDIIKKLIILEEDITIISLAEQFYVSRSIIVSDLEWVEAWLAAYKLELFKTQRKGIVVRGSEVSYRNAIAGFFDSFGSLDMAGVIDDRKGGPFPEKILQNVVKIYPTDTVEKVSRIITSAEKEFDFFLTRDYYTSLLTHIVISISRLISGNTMPPEFVPPDDEEFPAFIAETAEYIAKRLEAVFNIKVSGMEKTYICIHLVGFNALSADQSANAEMPKEIKYLAMELIKTVDSQLGTQFVSDKLLFFGLCMHLKSKVFRLKKDVYHRETSQFQLPENYSDIYNAVLEASNLYLDICNVKPDQEELLSITCYLLLARNRNLRKAKALLLCNDGIIERMEFMDTIGRTVPSVDIADCCTTYQLKLMAASEYDFIISLESLESMELMESLEKPVADLSAVDRSDYTQFIVDFINNIDL